MEVSKQDVYRLFLQAVMSRGVVSEDVAQILMRNCYKAVEACSKGEVELNQPSWNTFVQNLTDSVDKLDFVFRSIKHEDTGKVYYILANTKSDEISQLATDYSPAEIAFFKGVVELIMSAPNESHCVSSLVALREISNLKLNITKTQGEHLLSSFVARGWLNRSRRGRYSLAIRSLLELLPYLKSTYGDELLECSRCHEVLTRGVACPRGSCPGRAHYHCYDRFKVAQKNLRCPQPGCGADWPRDPAEGLKYVGEEAATEDDLHARRRTRRQTQESDEEEEEAASSNDDAPDATQVKKEKKPRVSRRASAQDDSDVDMDDEEEETRPTQATRKSTRQR